MKLKTLVLFSLFALNAQAIEINCFETDGFETLCSGVIDQSKVEYINCLDREPKNEQEQNLCSSINVGSDGEGDNSQPATLNCLDDSLILPEYSFVHQICSGVPKRESIQTINCLKGNNSSQKNQICKNVDTVEQELIKKLLWLSNQKEIPNAVDQNTTEISCLGDENGDIGDSVELSWCENQKTKAYTSCEKAAVQGLQSYFNLKFIDGHSLKVFKTVEKDSEYQIGYTQGPAESLRTMTVLVSKTEQSCFAVEIK